MRSTATWRSMGRRAWERKSGWCPAIAAPRSTYTTRSGTAAAVEWKAAGKLPHAGGSGRAERVPRVARALRSTRRDPGDRGRHAHPPPRPHDPYVHPAESAARILPSKAALLFTDAGDHGRIVIDVDRHVGESQRSRMVPTDQLSEILGPGEHRSITGDLGPLLGHERAGQGSVVAKKGVVPPLLECDQVLRDR